MMPCLSTIARLRRTASALFLLAAATVSCAVAASNSLVDEYEKLKSTERANQETPSELRSAEIGKLYESLSLSKLNDEEIKKLTSIEVRAAFDAANIASFYTLNGRYTENMSRALAELVRRRLANDGDYSDLFGSLVATRNFEAARALSRAHRDVALPEIPRVESGENFEAGRSLLVPSDDGLTLTRERVPATSGSTIIYVVSHPLCHFSQNAVQAIESDPVLENVFAEHSMWIMPASKHLDMEEIQTWNKHHANKRMSIVYSRDDWPQFKIWSTPVFYFVRDGNVVGKVVGWPKEGHREELMAEIRRSGLEG